MKKNWYVDFDGMVEGPFSTEDLKNDRRITPETLVWKIGFDKWVPIKTVPELDEVFKDRRPKENGKDKEGAKKLPGAEEEVALKLEGYEPPFFLFWILIIAIFAAYMIYQMFNLST